MMTRLVRLPRPLVTAERVVAGLVIILLGFFLLAALPSWGFGAVWLVLVVATVGVVRRIPVEPGAWLGLRAVRRGLVVVITLITLEFLIAPSAYSDLALLLLIGLALCDFALGRATRRIGTALPERLDERQEALRNRAHRIAYAILTVSVGLVALVASVATPETRIWLGDALHGGPAISFLQLLFFLPAMVIAWIEPDRIAGEDAPRLPVGGLAVLAYTMVGLTLALPFLLSFALAVAPIRTSAFTQIESMPASSEAAASNSQCRYFEGKKEAGLGFGATTMLSAVACWNGTKAYGSWGLNSSDCIPRRTAFVYDATIECRRIEAADGSLHFIYRTQLRSAVLPFIAREVALTLWLTKDGKVVQFP